MTFSIGSPINRLTMLHGNPRIHKKTYYLQLQTRIPQIAHLFSIRNYRRV